MDINDLRSIITVLIFLLFIGIVVWAWSRRAQTEFAEAERIPFEEDLPAGEPARNMK